MKSYSSHKINCGNCFAEKLSGALQKLLTFYHKKMTVFSVQYI